MLLEKCSWSAGALVRRLKSACGQRSGGALDVPVCSYPPETDPIAVELGLVEAVEPLAALPGWNSPRCIVVTQVSSARLAWLQESVPDVELVPVRSEQEALAVIGRAEAVIGWCTREMVLRGPRLRWIQIDTAGAEGMLRNIPELTERQILVSNLQRAAGPVIAEHVFAMVLALVRGLPRFFLHQRRGSWMSAHEGLSGLMSLHGRHMLVVGLGGIGAEVARLAQAFGMSVSGIRASRLAPQTGIVEVGSLDDLARMVADADVVVNAIPLTTETRNCFDAKIFAAMKPSALFINVARGRSVDTDALVEALAAGRMAGAGLDVVEPEPLPRRHPLWRMPNVLITPHIAGSSLLTREREWRVCRENLRRFVSGGKLLSLVDLGRGY